MSSPPKNYLISRSKSAQTDPNKSFLGFRGKKNEEITTDQLQNWLSTPRKDSLHNLQELSTDALCQKTIENFLRKPSRNSKSTTALNNSLAPEEALRNLDINNYTNGIDRSPSIKSLDSYTPYNSETFGSIDVSLQSSPRNSDIGDSLVDPISSRNSFTSKLSHSISETNFSPNLNSVGVKSPHRRSAFAEGSFRTPTGSVKGTSQSQGLKSRAEFTDVSTQLSMNLPAPAPAMYWHRVPSSEEKSLKPLRAHSSTLVGDQLFIFGGCNSRSCYNDIHIFDTDTMYWSRPQVSGTPPSPRRAHSATLIGKNIFIFGGGNSSVYYNDLHILDTETLCWTSPLTYGEAPTPRRAHSTCFYKNSLYVFGGGDGLYPLNDLYCLNLVANNGYQWTKIAATGKIPPPRGYHTATLVDNGQLVVFGGSDGSECFDDLFVLDLNTFHWREFPTKVKLPRLAHTATSVGPFLYITGGRNRSNYLNDLVILNLQRGTWEARKLFGSGPCPRGYHTTVIHDSRLFVFGGFDGAKFFNDMFILDLSASAYLSQVSPGRLLV